MIRRAFKYSDSMLSGALLDALKKMSPRYQVKNPVMFVVYSCATITFVLWLLTVTMGESVLKEPEWFTLSISLWLFFTVYFANFGESIAEKHAHAQADSLRSLRREIKAKRLESVADRDRFSVVNASQLRKDDLVLVEAGDFIPNDAEVVDGIASVDESAITGESAPVIRESDGDNNHVTGGTRILSDWLVIRIDCNSGETFLDKMVSLVESSKRQKTPSEVALFILLAAFTLTFLIVIATLLPFSIYSVGYSEEGNVVAVSVLLSLLVCLAPTTIGGLLSAIGIAGMNRLLRANIIAMSGRAIEAAGDVTVLLLDKTGTITFGNRRAEALHVAAHVKEQRLIEASYLSSLADVTPEGKSIVELIREKKGFGEGVTLPAGSELIEYSAETRLSGVKIEDREILKGAPDAIAKYLIEHNSKVPEDVQRKVEEVARKGGTPMLVVDRGQALGVIYLKDVVKADLRERIAELRQMNIRSVMITGDNPLTAAAIAAEAGVDDYQAEATPESKLILIRKLQSEGELVAMVGDGTNDAPALAQSDVAVCMNTGTQAAKEAANMIDLDSDPTKLIEIVTIGKQMLITRGALTTFSIANDISKYFAILPAAFYHTYPILGVLNIMHLSSPYTAILSAIIFNALIIMAMIPLALRGVRYRPMPTGALLRRNLLIYGLSGLLIPFGGIKLIDMLLVAMGVGG